MYMLKNLHKKQINKLLKLFISILLLFLLFSIINTNNLLETFRKFNPLTILITIVLYFIGVLISTFRWQTILKGIEIDIPKQALYKSYLIGGFANNFLPSSIGGDVSKLAVLKNYKYSKSEIGSSIILERVGGILTFVLIGLVLAPFFAKDSIVFIGLIFNLVVFTILIAPFILKKNIITLLNKIASKFGFLNFLTKKILILYTKVVEYRLTYKSLLLVFLYSFLFFSISVISNYIMFHDLNVNINILHLYFILSIVNAITILPISLNSIGLKELSYTLLFISFGVVEENALAVALVSRVALIFCTLSGGIILLMNKSKHNN